MGYVQSMNFIGAFLLLAGLDEEDAFWCLIALVDRVVPGYFSEGMAAAKLDQRVFARLLHAHLPAVGLHLESLAPDDIVTGIISSQWLLTLFVNVLPAHATMRVWDRVFAARDRAPLFAACIALLEPNAAAVLAAGDMGEAIELLQGLGDAVPPDEASADDFASRVDARLEGAIAPEKLARETARERGRRRRPSDAGLPERVRATAPVTEVDELVVGLASDLRDVVGPRALARMDAEAARDNEDASTGDGGEGDGDWEFADAPREMGMAWAEGLIAAGAGDDSGGDDSGDGLVDAAAAIRRMAAGGDRVEASAAASDETFVSGSGSDPDPGSGSGSPALAFGSPLVSLGVASSSPDPASGPRAASHPASLDLLGVDGLDHADPAGLALPHADAERIAERLLDVDRRLRALPTRASAFARAARITATRPLTATRTSRLDALRAEFARDETEFRLLTQRALALGNKGLSWRAGAGVDGGLEQGGALWNAWADSLFEHAFRRADALLLTLERVAAELDWVVNAVRGEPEGRGDGATNETRKKSQSQTDAGDRSDDDGDASTASTPPDDATVASARRRHAARLRDELRDVVSRVERCASDAAKDLPTLAANEAATRAELRREAASRDAALAEWSAAAETRRRRKTEATARAVRDAAEAAFDAFDANDADVAVAAAAAAAAAAVDANAANTPGSRDGALASAGGSTGSAGSFGGTVSAGSAADPLAEAFARLDAGAGCSASAAAPVAPSGAPTSAFDLEEARLDAASAALASATKALARRKAAISRERDAAEKASRAAAAGRDDADARLARLSRVSAAVAAALRARADPTTVPASAALAEDIVALGEDALACWSRLVSRWVAFLSDAVATAAMGYVTVIDAAAQCMHELGEEANARVVERERNGPAGTFGGFLEEAAGLAAEVRAAGAGFARRTGDPAAAAEPNEETKAGAATETKPGGSSAAAVVSTSGPSSGTSASSSATGSSGSSSATKLKDAFREQSTKAFQNLAGNLGGGMLKLQESFHGSAVGGWASRFGARGARGGGDAEGTELPETNARDPSASSAASPSNVSAESGPPLSPADGVSVSAAATPPAVRESRATQRDRADLRRLEERRDALMARKRRLRELIVARTESETSRVARPERRAVDAADVADVAPPPPVSLI